MAKKAQTTTKQGNKDAMFIFAYLLLWLSGLIVYVAIAKNNSRMKFHALQAVFLGIVAFIVSLIPIISIISLLLWIYGLFIGWQAYEGKDIEIPVLGEYAKQYSK
jgi:uncharacterized membrane protein